MKPPCTAPDCGRPSLSRGLCSSHYQKAKYHGALDLLAPNPSGPCEHCGQPIPEGRRWGAKYCSTDCKQKASDVAKHAALLARRQERVTICAWCRDSLTAEHRFGTRFCSRKCGEDWNNHQKALSAQRAKRSTRKPCEVCGDAIPETRNASAVYCSTACKRRSQRSVSPKMRRGQAEYNRRYLYGMSDEEYAARLEAQDNRCAICRRDDWPGKGNRPHVDHDHETGKIRGLLCGICNHGLGQFKDDPDLLRAAINYLERTRALS